MAYAAQERHQHGLPLAPFAGLREGYEGHVMVRAQERMRQRYHDGGTDQQFERQGYIRGANVS